MWDAPKLPVFSCVCVWQDYTLSWDEGYYKFHWIKIKTNDADTRPRERYHDRDNVMILILDSLLRNITFRY